ncbi:MAG: hypothetical protein RQ751_03255 [Longimicrobiales bacterium]|nr:hypothetical protein [Longimicrobiales bacterium]
MSGSLRAALAMAAVLGGLGVVAWRQGSAFEVQLELEGVESALAEARSQQARLSRDIRVLRSRERVVRDAGRRLGLRPPADQVRFLTLEEGR